MARELRNAKISFVSYVDKAANQTEFFFTKSAGPPSFEKRFGCLQKVSRMNKSSCTESCMSLMFLMPTVIL